MVSLEFDSAAVSAPVVGERARRRLVAGDSPQCSCGRPAAPHDPGRRISSHRTADGYAIYYRCECGRPRVAHMRWATR